MKEYIKNKIRNLILHEIEKSEKINKIEICKEEINALKENIEEVTLDTENIKNEVASTAKTVEEYDDKYRTLLERISKLEQSNLSDATDFKAFYNLLLKREPESQAIVEGKIQRKDLFNNIILSEEYRIRNENRVVDNELTDCSFAQAGEDRIILLILKLINIDYRNIKYLDLGANHAKEISNTFFWYNLGNKGVLVEANPRLCEELERERPNDRVINKFISDRDGEFMEFYILNGDGLSCGNKDSIDEFIKINPELKIVETIQVESISVETILSKYFNDAAPDILNIDIEGMELEILTSINFKNRRAKIIICEMIPYDTKLVVNQKNQEILDFMDSVGYIEYAFTGVNSIFIDKEALNKV